MGTHVAFLPALLRDAIQSNTISRLVRDPLIPRCLYRQGIEVEKWEATSGEQKWITRGGVIQPKATASTPRTDPTPKDVPIEQYEILAEALDDAIEIDVRQHFHTRWKETQRKLKAMGRQAGTSVGRWARNRLFNAYLGGDTWNTAQATAGASTITVQSIAGFRRSFDTNGRYDAVSASLTLAATIGSEAITIIGAAATSSAKPDGAGTLTISGTLAGTHAIGTRVKATNSPKIIRAGGATTTRGIGASDLITLSHIGSAVAFIRQMGVEPFPDGKYRCHLSPEGVRQLRESTDWKQQVEGVPDHSRVTGFEVGQIAGVVFVENPESPNTLTVESDENFAGAVTSTQTGAQNIQRAIVYGMDSIYEHRVPELEFEDAPGSAQWGVKGSIGSFVDMGNVVAGLVDGVAIYFRAPQDAKGERSQVTWSWTGDFGVPTDYRHQFSTAQQAYKRAVVIEHVDLQN